MTLTCVVITKNEENNIAECLKSLSFCDEVIVVDDYSSDKTLQKCKISNFKCQIYRRKLNADFASQRNFGLQKAKGKWVLFCDSDERVTKDLASEIVQIINDPFLSFKGFYLRRQDFIWGRPIIHGEVGAVRFLRLALRDSGVWKRRVHEYWDISGNTRQLKNPLNHYPHPTLYEFLSHINRMSSLHALANMEEGKRVSIIKIIVWPLGHFTKNFIIRRGFLDGMRGFVFALTMASHSFLGWSKLWMLSKGFRKI